jgi:hypothetical protein
MLEQPVRPNTRYSWKVQRDNAATQVQLSEMQQKHTMLAARLRDVELERAALCRDKDELQTTLAAVVAAGRQSRTLAQDGAEVRNCLLGNCFLARRVLPQCVVLLQHKIAQLSQRVAELQSEKQELRSTCDAAATEFESIITSLKCMLEEERASASAEVTVSGC